MKLNITNIKKLITSMNQLENNYYPGTMKTDVKNLLKRKKKFIEVANKYDTPAYIYDRDLHTKAITIFTKAFREYIPDLDIYFPMKINHHEYVIGESISNGLGIEVASVREFNIARKLGAKNILYYAPGKKASEITYIIKNFTNLRINIDSFSELEKIGKISTKLKIKVEVGVRINLPIHGEWTKYGINLDNLDNFWNESKSYRYINLSGIHFHTSRNKTPEVYVKSIELLADYLNLKFNKEMLDQIKYVDFGGGFDTNLKEGFYSWNTNLGKLKSLFGIKYKRKYFLQSSSTLEQYAKAIGTAIGKNLRPIINARYITEPGRILCNESMHILVKVADVINQNKIIADGGVNLVGWQRFEYEYFPLINLSNPSLRERECMVYGNLCTTWDLWGYYLYSGDTIKENDIIIIPYQGTLAYTLAQSFINPIAKVYKI